jgi:tRNA (mo5U34)-methyltransferase
MTDYSALYALLTDVKAHAWVERLPKQIQQAFAAHTHGSLAQWQAILQRLPTPATTTRYLDRDSVQIGIAAEISASEQSQLLTDLQALHPWRKGPFSLFGIEIDSEWRSNWKWQRLETAISPLSGRLVLDVGCGNGYYAWRMLGAGARAVIGIDPTLINVVQFQAVRKLYGDAPLYVLPLGIEAVPLAMQVFDTVFSMGVLYHRRSPLDHLLELRAALRSGGELVLETLVIDGGLGQILVPEDRYAQMRNVWFLPSCDTLVGWLKRCGFINIRVVNCCKTTVEEQRQTAWMRFQSLDSFLDPNNPNLSCEGLPAPQRAVLIAQTR